MRHKYSTPWWIIVVITFFISQASVLANDEGSKKTLSPYIEVRGENKGNLENLPLQETSVTVDITGVIANVKVQQTYQNNGELPIEAVYVFPGSTRAAVYGMKMTIGERIVTAKIKERKAAKKAYTEAKKQGKRASLLEQQRPNVFQMNVAHIMPGDKAVVQLSYTELIIPDQGIYEFAYPAVVGPRYSETKVKDADETESWINNPYLHQDKVPPYAFDINVSLSAGIPIQSLTSPSHEVRVDYTDKGSANIVLKSKSKQNADRDYILRYQLRGKEIKTGLLLHEGKEENFFLLMSQPPEQVAVENIPPREYIFVIDVSGSMHGFPLNTSKRLMAELLGNLRITDSFNIVFFSGGCSVLSESSLPVTETNIQKAMIMIDNQRGSGGTRLLAALKKAMALPAEKSTSRSFVVVTDGYISVEKEAFEYVKANLNKANFFSFGIGSSINRFLIEGLARAGQGEPFIVMSPTEAFRSAQRFREYIETPALTGINIDFESFDVYALEPEQPPDLFAERPLIVYGKWRGKAEGQIRITGHRGQFDYSESVNVHSAETHSGNEALRYFWARKRIAELGDYEKLSPDSERKAEITSLGLTYNLLTAYTSFIAIDEIVANPDSTSPKVKQPLPLPKGVSGLAVGGIIPTTPEPELIGLLSVLAGIFGVSFLSRYTSAFRR